MNYEEITELECESCGVKLDIHHDGCTINFCPVCGETVHDADDDPYFECDATAFDIY